MEREMPICYNCKHRKPKPGIGAFFCDAFPAGIPGDIILNVADHRKPFGGDNGIHFEAIDQSIPFPEFGPDTNGKFGVID